MSSKNLPEKYLQEKSVFDLRRTLAFRLTFRLTGIFACSTLVLFGLCYGALSHVERRKIDEELSEDAMEIGVALERKGITGALEAIENEALSEGVQQMYFEFYGSDGKLIQRSEATAWPRLVLLEPAAWKQGKAPKFATARIEGTPDQARIHEATFATGERLMSAYRLNDLERMLDLAGAFFGAAAAAITCLAAFIGWRITRRAMGGVEEVTQTARTIAAGQLDARVNISGWGTEIDRLALTFNEMIGRIGRLMTELRDMGDNIAHDLRTPVMRIRAGADGIGRSPTMDEETRSAAEGIIEECERLLGFINTRLEISEAESGLTSSSFEEMDLGEVAQDMVELYQPAAEDKGLTLTAEITGPVSFTGERNKIQRLLANLLDNAVKYTERDGKVSVKTATRGENVEIEVRDTGIGIPADSLPHVFERYYRADVSRSVPGNGLGLAYVGAVSRAWGGEATVESREGSGTLVRIILPKKAGMKHAQASRNIAKR